MSADEADRQARSRGYLVVRIDGREVPDKAALLARLAEALRFPDYFGRNLDALYDCLRDLDESAPAPGYLVVIENSGAACTARRGDFAAVVGVLEDAERYWRAQTPPKPFNLVLKD